MKYILIITILLSLSSAHATERGWGDILGEILTDALSSPEVTGAICSSLPEEFQKACQAGVGDPKAQEKALAVCSGFNMSDRDVNKCYQVASGGNFQIEAVDLCADMSFSAGSWQVSCLEKINGRSFDKSAIKVCASLWEDSHKLKCLESIASRVYTPGTADQCSRPWEDSSKISCLKELGM